MRLVSDCGLFSAWVEVDGVEKPVYDGKRVDGRDRRMEGYFASETGKVSQGSRAIEKSTHLTYCYVVLRCPSRRIQVGSVRAAIHERVSRLGSDALYRRQQDRWNRHRLRKGPASGMHELDRSPSWIAR